MFAANVVIRSRTSSAFMNFFNQKLFEINSIEIELLKSSRGLTHFLFNLNLYEKAN